MKHKEKCKWQSSLLIGIGILSLFAGATYVAWQYWKRKKNKTTLLVEESATEEHKDTNGNA